MRKIYFYDPHSHMDRSHRVHSGGMDYSLELVEPGLVPVDGAWYWMMDSHAVSRLPYFIPRNRRVAVLKESPVHTRRLDAGFLRRTYDLVLTHREDLLQTGAPFVRADFSTNWAMLDSPALQNIRKSRLVSFVGSIRHPQANGYAFRLEAVEVLKHRGGVDLFGWGIREMKFKTEGLVPYCFSVAMENCRENFYYTEKIIDCFFCETVPLYWGCPSIFELFDPRGLITFGSMEELLGIIEGLSFEKYQSMLPYVRENRERCIRLKLASYDDYLTRCIEQVERQLGSPRGPFEPFRISKPMAGLRLAGRHMGLSRF